MIYVHCKLWHGIYTAIHCHLVGQLLGIFHMYDIKCPWPPAELIELAVWAVDM